MTTDPPPPTASRNDDVEQLRVLSVLYFVYGGLAAVFMLVAAALIVAGLVFWGLSASWWESWHQQAGAAVAGCFFVVVGTALFVLLGVTAAVRVLIGVALARHRYYTLCLVAAGLTCLNIPLGAALGIPTLIVLLRPSVEQLFKGRTMGGVGALQ